MINETYKDNLRNTITESINNQIIFSYLSLLEDSCDFANDEIDGEFIKKNNEILDIIKFIENSIVNMETLLALNSNDRENIIQKITQYKKVIVSKYETFCSYIDEYGILIFYVEKMSSKKYVEKNEIGDIDFNKFISDCYKFIKASDSKNEEKYRTLQILKYIPITMTKEKYFDYISKSIKSEINGLTQLSISKFLKILKQHFKPSLTKDYDLLFPEIIKGIDTYIDLLKYDLSDEKLNEISKKTKNINNIFTNISQYFYILYKDLNYLTVLLYMGLDMDFIAGNNQVYIDLYKTTTMILNAETSKDDKEIYSEALINSLNNHIDQTIELQDKITNKFKKLMNKYNNIYNDKDLENIMDIDAMFKIYIDKNLNDDVYCDEIDNNIIADDTFIDEKIEEFIEFLRESIKDMGALERKICMQNLIAVLPPVWDIDENINYIEFSMKNTNLLENKILAMNRIGAIMRERGFIEEHNSN